MANRYSPSRELLAGGRPFGLTEKSGYFAQREARQDLRTDEDLNPLRERPDFRELLQRVQAKYDKPKAKHVPASGAGEGSPEP